MLGNFGIAFVGIAVSGEIETVIAVPENLLPFKFAAVDSTREWGGLEMTDDWSGV